MVLVAEDDDVAVKSAPGADFVDGEQQAASTGVEKHERRLMAPSWGAVAVVRHSCGDNSRPPPMTIGVTGLSVDYDAKRVSPSSRHLFPVPANHGLWQDTAVE